jgi:hypothetical protein
MAKKVLEVEIRGKDAISAELKKVGATADQTKRKLAEIEQAKGGGDKGGGVIKALKDRYGEESALGNVGKLAVGAGAVAAVSMIGQALANSTARAVELRNQFAAGTMSAEEMRVEIAKSLPIIGGFVAAGENMLELATGVKAELEQQKAVEQSIISVGEFRAAQLKAEKKLHREIGDTITAANARRQLATTGNDTDRTRLQTELDARKRQADLGVKRDDAKEAARAEADAAAKAIKDNTTLRRDAKVKAVDQIRKAQHEREAQIDREYNAAAQAEAKASEAEKQKALADQMRAGVDLVKQYDDETQRIQTQTRADELKALHRDLEAELLLIEQNQKDKRAAIAKALEQQLRTAPTELANELRGDAAAQAAAADAQADGQRAALIRQQLEDVHTRQLQAQAQLGNRAAELELKRLETVKQTAAEYQRLQAILNSPQATQQQKQQARAGISGLQAGLQADVVDQLKRQRTDLLEATVATTTNPLEKLKAQRELEAQKIRDEAKAKAADLQNILANPSATDAQKAQAQAQYQGYLNTTGRQFDNATNQPGPQRSGQFGLDESNSLSGISALAAEKASQDYNKQIATATIEGNKLQADLNRYFQQFVDQMKAGGSNPTSVFGS